jgi:hypothetical protein
MSQKQQNSKPNRPLPPALNPETPALVQPYKDFINKGWMTMSIEFQTLGVQVKCRVSGDVNAAKSGTDLSPGQCKELIIASGKWTPPTKKGTKTTGDTKGPDKPKKTLVVEDWGVSSEYLLNRAKAVAEALGSTVARGRISSCDLMVAGVDTFAEWWKVAEPFEKSRLLVDGKHHKMLSDAQHKALSDVLGDECPFLGPIPTPPKKEKAQEQRGGSPTSPPGKGKAKEGSSK